jgi:hypothetical protein
LSAVWIEQEVDERGTAPPAHPLLGDSNAFFRKQENEMAGILMWLMGVPLVVIVLLYLIF